MRFRGQSLPPAFLAALAACLLCYFLTGPRNETKSSTAEPGAYYGLLTDALLSGQTFLKAKPDPALKLLENPWAGNQGVPRLHDATYFHERYYLYFSAVPALLIGAPWHLATGQFLSDGATTFVGATFGLVLGSFFLLWAGRRWFATLPSACLVIGVLSVGLGNHVAVLVEATSVYPVPITCANACLMAALWALASSLSTSSLRKRSIRLALASLAWGLAVACRPNYLFSLLVVGLATAWMIAEAKQQRPSFPRVALGLGIAGILPAALIGAAMAAYNYVRFGSVVEFGTTYMFAGSDQHLAPMLSLHSLGANLSAYLFGPVAYGPYFPYVMPRSSGAGLLFVAPLAMLGSIVWPLTLLHRAFRRDPVWIITGGGLLLTFWLNLLAVCLLPTANERYFADFLPSAILLGLLTAGRLLRWWHECGLAPRLARAGGAFLATIVAWGLGHAIMLVFVHYPKPLELRPFARLANQITRQFERWQGVKFGAATVHVTFPARPPGTREPLLVSGDGRDVLYVTYLNENRIQIGFFHVGAGGPVSEPVIINPGQEHILTLNLGCLYPPADHPAFAGWAEPQIVLLRRQLKVSLDGRKLLSTGSEFYPTHPWDLHFGENPGPYFAPGKFTGTMSPPDYAGMPAPAALRGQGDIAAIRVTVRFPPFDHFKSEPLVSTGHSTAGDLLYVTYAAPGLIRFGHDSWGGGATETANVPYEPNVPQVLEIEMPSFSSRPPSASDSRLIVRYNGSMALAEDRPYHQSDPAELFFGFNGCDSSAAPMVFSGKIDRVERIARLVVPTEQFQRDPGPARLVLRFPLKQIGRSEPLLATGHAGAADVVYVQYVDEAHVRLGYDHWSVGGPLSAVLPVDYGATHVLEVQMGSLYPDAGDSVWASVPTVQQEILRHTIIVKLDGHTAISHRSLAYRSPFAEIIAGQNTMGASSCASEFTGRIFISERLGMKALAP